MSKAMSFTLTVMLTSLANGQIVESMTVAGQVQDSQARNVAGAEVAVMELCGDGFNRPKSVKLLDMIRKTDHEGRFFFEVRVGPQHDILVVARKSGLALGWQYIYREHPFLTKARNSRAVTIYLGKPNSIAGRVLDAAGKVVAGANVQVVPHIRNGVKDVRAPRDWISVKTDAKGHFAFDNLPIDTIVKFNVEIPHSDIIHIYPPEAKRGNAGGGYRVDEEDVEIKLPPGASVQARVTDKDTGQGIRGIRLLLSPERNPKCLWRDPIRELYSGTDGIFSVKGVPPGQHALHCMSDQTDWVGQKVSITIGKQAQPVSTEIEVEKGIALQVLVRDQSTRRELAHINVYVHDNKDDQQNSLFSQSRKTNTQGIAQLMVPRGVFRIHAWGENYDDGLKEKGTRIDTSVPRTRPVEISVKPRMPLVRGMVVDTQDQPVAHIPVEIGMGQSVLTDSQGGFAGRQNPLYPSHLVVARDTERNLVGMAFFSNASRELHVVLKPGASIRGRVTDEMDRGVPGAKVWIRLEKRMRRQTDPAALARMTETRTDSEGYLNNIRHHLRRNGIELVCIQVTPVNEADFKAWKKENKISIPIELLPGDAMGMGKGSLQILKDLPDGENPLKEKWGIRSLPWTVLADENQEVTASGFQASHIFQVAPPKGRRSPIRRNSSRRR